MDLISNSPFIGAEVALKTMLKGFPVGEMGIQTFKRQFGKGACGDRRKAKRRMILFDPPAVNGNIG